ncbi:hypothetical protein TA3x_003611 [Tundrisphaera sp. TA3]|uniref:hypothetical protein n=1 Tax=Tundrisphaera sp. TA3 TaxID=3435775 RepID=UPI003EBAF4F8
MTRKREPAKGMFRGSELRTMLLLAAIVVVGWPVILLSARPGTDAPAPRPPLTASSLTPIVPDGGIEFEALVDKMPMQPRDNPAYQILLRRAREATPAALARSARRDVLFTHLLERPERYRGVPVHLEGTVLRVLTYEANTELAPGGRLYEAWLYSDENRRFPYVVIFEEPPKGFPIGPDVHLRVSFDGYFLKLLRYMAGDSLRAAPLLVGRIRWDAPAPSASRSSADRYGLSGVNVVYVVIGMAVIYIGLRAFFAARRHIVPKRPRPSLLDDPRPEPPPDIDAWLRDLPDDDEPGPRPRE